MPLRYSRFAAVPKTAGSRMECGSISCGSTPYGITCIRRRGKPYCDEKRGERMRRHDHGAEIREQRLDPDDPVQQPGDPARETPGGTGSSLTADPDAQLLRHAVQRVHRQPRRAAAPVAARAARPGGRACGRRRRRRVQARPARRRARPACARIAATDGVDTEVAELRRQRLARDDDVDVDSGRRHRGREVANV